MVFISFLLEFEGFDVDEVEEFIEKDNDEVIIFILKIEDEKKFVSMIFKEEVL